MPIYEYECDSCHKIFSEQKNINDDSPSYCPKCKQEGKKIISKTTFVINGFKAANNYS